MKKVKNLKKVSNFGKGESFEKLLHNISREKFIRINLDLLDFHGGCDRTPRTPPGYGPGLPQKSHTANFGP